MKKTVTLLSFFLTIFVSAQEAQETNVTEVKINGLSISLGTVEFEFERSINSNSSFGTSFFTTFNDSNRAFAFDYDSGITGFYRYYLGKNFTSGIFLEGFGMFHNTRRPKFNAGTEIASDFLIGLGLGYKWVSKNGIILQTNFSPGINLFNKSINRTNGRAGISIGYRF